MLNKTKGNMYSFISHTWNPIKGKCPHDCSYCYMKRFPQGELRLDEKDLKTNLGENNFIFVGSSTDMFAGDVPDEWIIKVLNKCIEYPKNRYIFQSKNPERMFLLYKHFPKTTMFGTTIESNRHYYISKCTSTFNRQRWMNNIYYRTGEDLFKETFVSIEPILDFDLGEMVAFIKNVQPEFVSIGADSKGHNLPEPSKEKIEALISELKKFTEVRIKKNLKRIIGGD